MDIKYTPFNIPISAIKKNNWPETQETTVQAYFVMSLRYETCYYKKQSEGETIYFLNFLENSILFYFAKTDKDYRIRGFRFEVSERKKAWISLGMLIEELRYYAFDQEREPIITDDFLDNAYDFLMDCQWNMVPQNIIISTLPAECFPQSDSVKLYNRLKIKGSVEKDLIYVVRAPYGANARMEDYDKLSSMFLLPPNRTRGWCIEYIDKQKDTFGKKDSLKMEIKFPGNGYSCGFDALVKVAKEGPGRW